MNTATMRPKSSGKISTMVESGLERQAHVHRRVMEVVASGESELVGRSMAREFGPSHMRPGIRRRFAGSIVGEGCIGWLDVDPTFIAGSADQKGASVASGMSTWFTKTRPTEGEMELGAAVGNDVFFYPHGASDGEWHANTASGVLIKTIDRPAVITPGAMIEVCLEVSRPTWDSWGRVSPIVRPPTSSLGYQGIARLEIGGPGLTSSAADWLLFTALSKSADGIGGINVAHPKFTLSAKAAVGPEPEEIYVQLAAQVWAYRVGPRDSKEGFAGISIGSGAYLFGASAPLKVSAISVAFCPPVGPNVPVESVVI